MNGEKQTNSSKPSLKSAYWVNGEPCLQISLQDRALQYGDGFFTTLLVRNQQLLNWPAHWQRIEESAKRLDLPLIEQTQLLSWLSQALTDYLSEHNTSDCVVKIIQTRGVGGAGYQAPQPVQANWLFILKPAPLLNVVKKNKAMVLGLCEMQAAILPALAGLKHLNRLENVLARTEIVTQGFSEGIMCNAYDHVISGTQANVFVIKGQNIITPKLDQSGVAGTTRFQLANLLPKLGWHWQEQVISLDTLKQADEIFMANAVRGIQPVSCFLNQSYDSHKTAQIDQAWSTWLMQNGLDISQCINLINPINPNKSTGKGLV